MIHNSYPEALRLKSTKKYFDSKNGELTRAESVQDTLKQVEPLCPKIGITRISDITFLDRLYIPNYSAVLPGTEDVFWVYGGKGPTKPIARASAIMETIERHSSLPNSCLRPVIQGTYSQLSKSFDKVLHPTEIVEPVNLRPNDKDPVMDYLQGFDLLSGEMVLVPAEIALYKYSPKFPAISAFTHSHTNGLASGNVIEEAICHALCEVIERDAVSIADLCSSCIAYNILEKIDSRINEGSGRSLVTLTSGEKFVDDASLFPEVDITEVAEEYEPLKRLVRGFADAGIPLLIKDITQKDISIPTFVGSSIEWISQDYGFFAKGYGTHPDSRIALMRAISELSQTRAVNIQGSRDNLKKIRYKENDEIYKRKWQFMPSPLKNHNSSTKRVIKFSEIKTYTNRDILDDINLIGSRLKESGLRRAIIVVLTNPYIGIPVVRAIVPGLETFEVTGSIMGNRAKEHFRLFYES